MSAEFFTRLKRIMYTASGILLGLTSIKHLFPSITKQESELKINVPPELQARVEAIATSMHVGMPHRIKVYINKGLSSNSAGNSIFPYGAVVGLSSTVLCHTTNDIEKLGLELCGEEIDWRSKDGQLIAELLLPTREQVDFAIAHELSHIQHLDFLSRSLLAAVSPVIVYHATSILPQFFTIKNPMVQLLPFTIGGVYFIYNNIYYALCHWQEHRADNRAGLCGRSYSEGGITFAKKRIELDKRLRALDDTSSRSKSFPTSFTSHPSFEDRLERLTALHRKQQM
ncbi:PREDICTED: transmembrane protein 177-like [Amphimedon queenslandica]|uniref:Peptidase M48 domain-containing protein n=1 Tax=Amphimedon queenslandica TaxID=400682 RepID=A0A1X7VB02_AMPQE|nr:PREDICTED: transmembrane protein 177-like [Amphimedon queenslandica]|eukprot:XP_019849745.1 PREDICTED: transmembrane protein 177-like [Amphimedon queenslandica]